MSFLAGDEKKEAIRLAQEQAKRQLIETARQEAAEKARAQIAAVERKVRARRGGGGTAFLAVGGVALAAGLIVTFMRKRKKPRNVPAPIVGL